MGVVWMMLDRQVWEMARIMRRGDHPDPARRGEVALAIRPGTWVKRRDRLVLAEESSLGNEVYVQVMASTAEGASRAMNFEVSTKL
jgi:hypothetical protein